MGQDLRENGLKNLNVLRYWKYVLKNKNPRITCVIAKPIEMQVYQGLLAVDFFVTEDVYSLEELNYFRGTVVTRGSICNENAGEFWSKVDYLYADKNDPIRLIAMACGVTCLEKDLEFRTILTTKPQSLDRVNNFEMVKNILT